MWRPRRNLGGAALMITVTQYGCSRTRRASHSGRLQLWLQQRGLNVDHNAVWRTYSKEATGSQSQSIYERNEQLEQRSVQEEAMPWLKE